MDLLELWKQQYQPESAPENTSINTPVNLDTVLPQYDEPEKSLLNQLFFGNPNESEVALINTPSFLDSLFEEASQILPPANDSEIVKAELNNLYDYLQRTNGDANMKARFEIYDSNLFGFLKNVLANSGGIDLAEVSALIDAIWVDVSPLLSKLKHHFNRPRPSQLAYYYQFELFPVKSFVTTASYPSGHAFYAKVICNVLATRYPEYYKQLRELSNDICMSRPYLALNFQSDIDLAYFLSDKVLANIEFKKKYRL